MRRTMFLRILVIFIVWLAGFSGHDVAMAIEEANYTVLEKDGVFELRQYEARIVAETFVEGDFSKVGNVAFRRLHGYICGNNRKREEIAITAPVSQEANSEKIAMTAPVGQERVNGKWRITFVMPTQYTMETLPEPPDPDVTLQEEPGRLMAAIRYSGTWSQTRYMEREVQLREWIKAQRLQQIGEPIFARYNPPFMPWFLRRNEVLIPVERCQTIPLSDKRTPGLKSSLTATATPRAWRSNPQPDISSRPKTDLHGTMPPAVAMK